MFAINATVGGFYYITALYAPMYFSGQLQIYTGAFDPANPCTNIRLVETGTTEAPHSAVVQHFTSGVYDVVITSTDSTDAGLFAVHADPTIWNGG